MPPLYTIHNPILGTLRVDARGALGQYVCADSRGRHLLWFGWTLKHGPREAIPPKVVAVLEPSPLILVVLEVE